MTMTNERYPPEINWFFTHLARLLLRITGWRYEGELPNVPKFIIVSYPHTSNWDGLIVVVVAMAVGAERCHPAYAGGLDRHHRKVEQ